MALPHLVDYGSDRRGSESSLLVSGLIQPDVEAFVRDRDAAPSVKKGSDKVAQVDDKKPFVRPGVAIVADPSRRSI